MGVDIWAFPAASMHNARYPIKTLPASCFNNVDDTSYPIFEKLGLDERKPDFGVPIQASLLKIIIKEIKEHFPKINSRSWKNEVHDDFEATLYFLKHCSEWAVEHDATIRFVIA